MAAAPWPARMRRTQQSSSWERRGREGQTQPGQGAAVVMAAGLHQRSRRAEYGQRWAAARGRIDQVKGIGTLQASCPPSPLKNTSPPPAGPERTAGGEQPVLEGTGVAGGGGHDAAVGVAARAQSTGAHGEGRAQVLFGRARALQRERQRAVEPIGGLDEPDLERAGVERDRPTQVLGQKGSEPGSRSPHAQHGPSGQPCPAKHSTAQQGSTIPAGPPATGPASCQPLS